MPKAVSKQVWVCSAKPGPAMRMVLSLPHATRRAPAALWERGEDDVEPQMDLKHNEGNEVTQDNARKQIKMIKMIKSSSGQCLRVDAPTLGRNGYRER